MRCVFCQSSLLIEQEMPLPLGWNLTLFRGAYLHPTSTSVTSTAGSKARAMGFSLITDIPTQNTIRLKTIGTISHPHT